MSKSQINLTLLKQYFEDGANDTFSISDLTSILVEHSDKWSLPRSMTPQGFLKMLLRRTKLREVQLKSPSYSPLLRYTWGNDASPVSIANSIKDGAFFSHASAMWIHGLGGGDKNIFINKEQSEKPPNSGQLSQDAIHRAFRNQQRHSKLTYKYKHATITVLNGKNTGRAAVGPITTPSGHKVDVTSLERTLIDITVRPGYSGGVSSVLRAYRLAKNRVSVKRLLSLLDEFDYTYPYHQSIGFYFNRAGYNEADQALARTDGVQFDFYLCHGLKDPAFDSDWRVFFPRTLK
jgi:hypothetical protein